MNDIIGASMVRAAVNGMHESIKKFSDSSDRLAKVMIIVMVVQILVACGQLYVAVMCHK